MTSANAQEANQSITPLPFRKGGPGVGSALTFRLVAEDTGSVLAKVAAACAASGIELTAASTTEPTLERVFLSLTGRELRD